MLEVCLIQSWKFCRLLMFTNPLKFIRYKSNKFLGGQTSTNIVQKYTACGRELSCSADVWLEFSLSKNRSGPTHVSGSSLATHTGTVIHGADVKDEDSQQKTSTSNSNTVKTLKVT